MPAALLRQVAWIGGLVPILTRADYFGPRQAALANELMRQKAGCGSLAVMFRAKHAQQLREPVSISRETTFERDLHAVRDKAELSAVFTRLCEQVASDLQRKGYLGKTIGIKLRYDDFKGVTRDQTIDRYIADAASIRRAAGQALKRAPLTQRLRLLGVRVGALIKEDDAKRYSDNKETPHHEQDALLFPDD